MSNPIRIRYFLWLTALLCTFWLINSFTLLTINLPEIISRGPDWRDEFNEWLVITGVGALVMPVLLYAAWRLSGRLLQPLRDMVRTSNRIYSGHFDERIHIEDTHDEIAELASSLNRALDRYQEVGRRQKHFASAASHQLRTPLAAIRSTGEVALQHKRDTEGYCDAIGQMLEDASRLSHVVEQLLLMAKLSREELETTFKAVDAQRLVQEVIDGYQPLIQAKQLQVACSGEGGLMVRGDEALLSQALTNLVDNAIRHTPSNGTITLTVAPITPAQVEICVNDSGSGFSSSEAEQGLGADSPDARSGLGLYIVRDILQAHDGDVRMGTSSLGGASVCLRLPLFR